MTYHSGMREVLRSRRNVFLFRNVTVGKKPNIHFCMGEWTVAYFAACFGVP